MEVYTKVERSFWQDDFILDLTPEEKYFYLYLMTNNKVNTLGVYVFPLRMAAVETGYNVETIGKLLQRFCDLGKIAYDPETKEVFLKNWGKRNWTKKTAVLRAMEKDRSQIKSVEILKIVTQQYETWIGKSEADNDKQSERTTGSDEEQTGTFGNTEELSGTLGNNGEKLDGRIENRELENREFKDIAQDCAKENKFNQTEAFEQFYQAYPRKKSKDAARKRWDKLKVTPALFAEIMQGLERAKKQKEWQDIQFIQYPATWLNSGGWKDEPDTPQQPQPNTPEQKRNTQAVSDELARRRKMAGVDL